MTVYTAFGTTQMELAFQLTVEMELHSISTVAPVGSSVGALYQKLYIHSKKVLLRMGEFVPPKHVGLI